VKRTYQRLANLHARIAELEAELAEWERWTQGHVWIRTEEYAELCALKLQHGRAPMWPHQRRQPFHSTHCVCVDCERDSKKL
jgi:hypothetical protein